MPITTAPVRALSNVVVTYNAGDITGACNTAQLSSTVNEIETTTLASTGKETTPGQTEWSIEVGGPWSKELDTILAPDLVTPPATKRNASIQFGPLTNRVTYTWTANAFVSNFTIDASNPSESLSWTGTLVLSGAPVRTTA
jgi:hypothetical protein